MGRLFGTDGIRGVANVDLQADHRLRPRAGDGATAGRAGRRDRRGPGHAPLGRHVRGRDRRRRDEPGRRRPRRSASCPTPALAFLAGERRRSRPGSWSRPRTTRPTTTASRCSTRDGPQARRRDRGRARAADLARRRARRRRQRRRSAGSIDARGSLDALPRPPARRSRGRSTPAGCASCSTARTARAASVGPEILAATGATVEVIHAEPDGVNINVELRRDRARRRWPRGRRASAAPTSGSRSTATPTGCIAVDARRRASSTATRCSGILALDRLERGRAAGRRPRRVGAVERRARRRPSRRPAARSSGRRSATSTSSRGCRSSGAGLGGEKSGHVIVLEHTTSGDGIVTALEVLRVMTARGAALAELAARDPAAAAAAARRAAPVTRTSGRATRSCSAAIADADAPARRRAAGSSSGRPARSPRCG